MRTALSGAYRDGFRLLFILNAALAALAFMLAWFLLPQLELKQPVEKEAKEGITSKKSMAR